MNVEKLSLEQLFKLNKRIIERIEYLQSLKTRAHLDRFEVGDQVSFPSEGHQIKGVVIRVNKKTVSIKTNEGSWRIPPRFLTRIPELRTKISKDVRDIIERQES